MVATVAFASQRRKFKAERLELELQCFGLTKSEEDTLTLDQKLQKAKVADKALHKLHAAFCNGWDVPPGWRSKVSKTTNKTYYIPPNGGKPWEKPEALLSNKFTRKGREL